MQNIYLKFNLEEKKNKTTKNEFEVCIYLFILLVSQTPTNLADLN